MMRLVLSSLSAVGLAVAAASALGAFAPALAEATTKPAKKDDASKPALVATFGDWNVFVGQVGKGRICYTLAAAENARAFEPQARSGLRIHLRPPGGRGAQRSVVHHGLRHRGGRR